MGAFGVIVINIDYLQMRRHQIYCTHLIQPRSDYRSGNTALFYGLQNKLFIWKKPKWYSLYPTSPFFWNYLNISSYIYNFMKPKITFIWSPRYRKSVWILMHFSIGDIHADIFKRNSFHRLQQSSSYKICHISGIWISSWVVLFWKLQPKPFMKTGVSNVSNWIQLNSE